MTGKTRVEVGETGSGTRRIVASSSSGGLGVFRVRTFRSFKAASSICFSWSSRAERSARVWTRVAS